MFLETFNYKLYAETETNVPQDGIGKGTVCLLDMAFGSHLTVNFNGEWNATLFVSNGHKFHALLVVQPVDSPIEVTDLDNCSNPLLVLINRIKSDEAKTKVTQITNRLLHG